MLLGVKDVVGWHESGWDLCLGQRHCVQEFDHYTLPGDYVWDLMFGVFVLLCCLVLINNSLD